ncbi:MAG: UvrB/UvrC motif-containing protein [Thermoguttaceae bacterium]|nr:UvrB/UvrC motif-containing protein [Thermoguttaceae bacterium]MBR4752489.1 UvrB/UvrC motif-containing protein [Thermoguttaceae bacterium]MBR5758269.1 UvrB/UvrC motif-containing protein [Thermoguttaceae bacterium]
MKCQKCDKVATFHITEVINAHPEELHLCDEHAYEYLHHNDAKHSPDPKCHPKPEPYDGEGYAADQDEIDDLSAEELGLKDFTEELEASDDVFCKCCELTFLDFRKTGKFGCENDYIAFKERIEPLFLSIHGAVEHVGKKPSRFKVDNSGATLVSLRNQLAEAIRFEKYEQASVLRDKINALSAQEKS